MVKIEPTSEFYPDFLVWKDKDVFALALDTTGGLCCTKRQRGSFSRLHLIRGRRVGCTQTHFARSLENEKVENLSKTALPPGECVKVEIFRR